MRNASGTFASVVSGIRGLHEPSFSPEDASAQASRAVDPGWYTGLGGAPFAPGPRHAPWPFRGPPRGAAGGQGGPMHSSSHLAAAWNGRLRGEQHSVMFTMSRAVPGEAVGHSPFVPWTQGLVACTHQSPAVATRPMLWCFSLAIPGPPRGAVEGQWRLRGVVFSMS